jgi:hypothetical protein
MSGIPDWQWDEIQRGRDPDSLSRERARDEGFERTQRESEREIDRWKLDVERDRGLQQTAASSTSPRIVSPREDIRLCRRDILDSIQFCVWLDRNLKDDWRSRLANLTDAGWQEELAELRRDVARETEAWRRANANSLWRREQYGDFLRDLGVRLEHLELKCTNVQTAAEKRPALFHGNATKKYAPGAAHRAPFCLRALRRCRLRACPVEPLGYADD